MENLTVTLEDDGNEKFVRITNIDDDTYVNVPIESVVLLADLLPEVIHEETYS